LDDYRAMKKRERGKAKNNDGGLTSLKETREKLLKSDDHVVRTLNQLINYFSRQLRRLKSISRM
jgi:hypothetical protein